MIPEIGLLLCAYLIFKGVEIYMLYRTSAREDTDGRAIAIGSLIMAILIALVFAADFLAFGTKNRP